ncbi:MAG: amidohydrolase [Bacteroidetes bacterium]|nr:amidohydrolase [Bacteroidota bacterium]
MGKSKMVMNLKVTVIQSELHWENAAKNLAMFTEKIASINEAPDVIVLPEMFTTGFTMNSAQFAETMEGETVVWMKQQAKSKNAAIVGSLIIEEDASPLEGRYRGVNYFNRLIWAQPDGKIYTYDKRHLFRMAGEHEHFSAGKTRLIVELKGWKICPLICYDLRFPVWSRNKEFNVQSLTFKVDHSPSAFDLLIYVANWPEARKTPWSKLLEARAIENQVYVVGVNRVGVDGKQMTYSGNSAVIDPKGNVMSNIAEHQNYIQTIELNREELDDFRAKFPVGLDGDDFEIFY